jgi:hypothetical protein
MIARTIENEETILNAVKEDGTRSIGEIASPLGISSRTVYLQSPDLNPLGFFLWGHVKNFVYKQPQRRSSELESKKPLLQLPHK